MTRKNKVFDRKKRFVAAVLVAALFGINRLTLMQLVRAVRMLFRALTAKAGDVDRWTYFRELRACHRCPIFVPLLRTCGSPLASDPSLGCWCEMTKKATLKEAQCWLDEQGIESEYSWKANGL